MPRVHIPSEENKEDIKKSKTKRKQEMLELQQLGVKLCDLKEQQLRAMELPEQLLQAILQAKRLNSHGAMRRQAQYIGKIMRHIDSEPIMEAYLKLQSKRDQESAQFHQLEQWRERLLHEEAAVEQWLSRYPHTDEAALKQLVEQAIADNIKQRNSGSKRRLLQFLKNISNSR